MVLVFKTNLSDKRCVNDIASWFEKSQKIIDWSIDLEDCDKVLRVVTEEIPPENIIEIVHNAGYQCEVLK